MATALKDIQFSSPVLNGTTANNKTTWTFGENDVVEFYCGCEYHSGCEYHGGCVTFGDCSYENHYGYEYHYGTEYHCGDEDHCGGESHCGCEYHSGDEDHCGGEDHLGWVKFTGSCSCATDGFDGTNIRVSGIAVVDPIDPSNKVLLTYSELKAHGF